MIKTIAVVAYVVAVLLICAWILFYARHETPDSITIKFSTFLDGYAAAPQRYELREDYVFFTTFSDETFHILILFFRGMDIIRYKRFFREINNSCANRNRKLFFSTIKEDIRRSKEQ